MVDGKVSEAITAEAIYRDYMDRRFEDGRSHPRGKSRKSVPRNEHFPGQEVRYQPGYEFSTVGSMGNAYAVLKFLRRADLLSWRGRGTDLLPEKADC